MSPEKLRALLTKCGVQRIVDRGTDLQALCPHHDESDPSWGISKTEPHFHGCFGCGFKGTIVGLVAEKMKVSRVRASQICETKLITTSREITIREEEYEIPVTLEEAWHSFVPAPEAFRYLMKRGVSRKSALEMQVRYDFDQKRVLFPWRINHSVIGITGRLVTPDPDPKFKTLPYAGTKKGRFLYLPSKIFSTTDSRLVLVEGEIDAALVMQDVTPNVVALGFGTFTDKQRELLLSFGKRDIVIFTDDDSAGFRIAKDVALQLRDFARVRIVDYALVRQFYPKSKLDPGSLETQHRRRLIEAAKSDLSI